MWTNLYSAEPECNFPTMDAGKECTDSNQCESFCQVKEGTEIGSMATGECYGFNLAICMQEVQNEKLLPA